MALPIKGLKTLLSIVKFYLSSLTARSCKYLCFNCLEDPDTMVFTNGDQTMLVMEAYELSLHIVKFKQYDLSSELKKIFAFQTSQPYVVHLKKSLTVINACLKTNQSIKTYVDVDDQILLTMESDIRSHEELQKDLEEDAKNRLAKDIKQLREDGDEYDESDFYEYGFQSNSDDSELDTSSIVLPLLEYSHAFGTKFDDFRNVKVIKDQSDYIMQCLEDMPNAPHIVLQPNEISKFRSNVYRIDIDLNDFKTSTRELVFPNATRTKYTHLLQDGLDVPSLKEFVNKLPSDWDIHIYLFVDKTRRLCILSTMSNGEVEVVSMRPFVGIFPIETI